MTPVPDWVRTSTMWVPKPGKEPEPCVICRPHIGVAVISLTVSRQG